MQRRMLRTIKARAEALTSAPSSPSPRPIVPLTPPTLGSVSAKPGVDLYWIPLGAGARVVRISGRIFETISAVLQRRPQRDLYHSALVAVTSDAAFTIEMTPIADARGRDDRGVVAEGTVGTTWARRLRIFRYEIRRWRDGVIPDISYAVGSPVRLTDNEALARKIVELVPLVPTPVWGRDELHAGEMWNSNSVTSWILTCAGLDAAAGQPPNGGRAPGWDAGVTVAQRRPSPELRAPAA